MIYAKLARKALGGSAVAIAAVVASVAPASALGVSNAGSVGAVTAFTAQGFAPNFMEPSTLSVSGPNVYRSSASSANQTITVNYSFWLGTTCHWYYGCPNGYGHTTWQEQAESTQTIVVAPGQYAQFSGSHITGSGTGSTQVLVVDLHITWASNGRTLGSKVVYYQNAGDYQCLDSNCTQVQTVEGVWGVAFSSVT